MDINTFLQNYDTIAQQGSREAAAAFLRDGKAVAEAERDEHALVTILNEESGFLRDASRYAEAIAAAERALGILKSMNYENTVPFGTTLLNAATAYRASGDNANALALFIQSLTVLSGLLPEDDCRLAGLYNNISIIFEEKEQFDEAIDALKKAEDILAGQPQPAEDAAIVLTNQARLLLRKGCAAEASAMLEKAELMFRRSGTARMSPHYAAALAGMAEACFRAGDHEGAARAYAAALGHIADAFGENRDFAILCQNCAEAWEKAGQPEKASELRDRAAAALGRLGLDG